MRRLQLESWVCLSIVLMLSPRLVGETRYVSVKGSAESPFTSWATAAHDVATALDVAEDGDTVLVAAGTYHQARAIVVNRPVLLRSAAGAQHTVLGGTRSPKSGWCFEIRSDRAIVDGFTITGFGGGVRFDHREGTSAAVRNSVIVRNSGHGVFFNHGGCAKNCTIAYNGGAGLYAYDMGGGGDEPANLILFGNERGFVRESANIGLRNCYTDDPHFVSETDLRLRPDSPCIDAGRNESWMAGATDAAGSPRIRNRVVDIGAYESAAKPSVRLPHPEGDVSVVGLSTNKRGWIALAPLVDAGRDTRDAEWMWDGRSAIFGSGKPRAWVTIPVEIDGSYELRARITILRAKEVTAIHLPVANHRSLAINIRGDRGNSESPTATISVGGIGAKIESRGNTSVKIGESYSLYCRVLRSGNEVGIQVFRDGGLLFEWAGSQSQLDTRERNHSKSIELETAYYTRSRLAAMRLRMSSGSAAPLYFR